MPSAQSRRNRLVVATFVAMILGVTTGCLLSSLSLSPGTTKAIVGGLDIVTSVFLRLMRMVVAPLVLATLAAGIAQVDGGSAVRKIGLRAIGWFICFSLAAIATGLIIVDLLGPGRGMRLTAPPGAVSTATGSFDLAALVDRFVPNSLFDAMAQNHLLQIVVFALFAGAAMGALGERVAPLRHLTEQVAAVMMTIVTVVVRMAPLAVFAALTATVLERGVGAIAVLGRFVFEFYIALAATTLLIVLAGTLFLGRRMRHLIRLMREPVLIAFSTASSEAALAASLQAVEKFGVAKGVAGFVLPLGYAFNLAGSLAYASFALLFIAQSYDIHLSVSTQMGLMLFLAVTNVGVAGVPRALLLVIAGALETFHLPAAGLGLILGVDAVLDMGRTAINVFGNAVVTAVVASQTGALSQPSDVI